MDYAERTRKIAWKPNKKEEERTPKPQTELSFQAESSDKVGTFKLIKNAVGRSTRRELDHLLDAQRAIGNALEKMVNQYRSTLGYEAVDELAEEAVEKKQVRCKFCAPDVVSYGCHPPQCHPAVGRPPHWLRGCSPCSCRAMASGVL